MKKIKWFTIISLIILIGGTAMGWYRVWGVLFLWWGIYEIIMGRTFLVEDIRRDDHVILFWLITLMWLVFGVLALVFGM